MVRYKTASVDGLDLFYREAGEPTHPRLERFHRERVAPRRRAAIGAAP